MAPISEVFNGCCMEMMAKFPNGHFDLAIVDPPYGKYMSNYDRPNMKTAKFSKDKIWDDHKPNTSYFTELFRVTQNQIIWGLNHFMEFLPSSNGFVCWYKHQNGNFSECELAWCSTGKGRFFDRPFVLDQYNKIHPTQKPVALYTWLLQNYAKPGWKILDTHLGSMGSRIAAYKLGFDFWGAELDPDYYRDGCKRFDEAIRMPLFDAERERKDIVQTNFFDALDGL